MVRSTFHVEITAFVRSSKSKFVPFPSKIWDRTFPCLLSCVVSFSVPDQVLWSHTKKKNRKNKWKEIKRDKLSFSYGRFYNDRSVLCRTNICGYTHIHYMHKYKVHIGSGRRCTESKQTNLHTSNVSAWYVGRNLCRSSSMLEGFVRKKNQRTRRGNKQKGKEINKKEKEKGGKE